MKLVSRPPSIWIGLLGLALLCFESWKWRSPPCGGTMPCNASGGSFGVHVKLSASQMRAEEPSSDTRPTTARDAAAVAALLARPAQVHGRLNKAGLPAVLPRGGLRYYRYKVRFSRDDPAYDTNIVRWVETMSSYNTSIGVSRRVKDAAAVAALRSPAPSCFYFVDHTYKVIYARTTKTAGSAVSQTFGFIENANNCARYGEEYCAKACIGKAMCLNRTLDAQQLYDAWQDYTVFGVARNPYARAVSSWAYNNVRFLANTSCVKLFQTFAALPSAYPFPCMDEPNAQWLMALNHIEPQGECLFTADGKPAVDFLARTENLEEDMQELVRLINERRPPGVAEHPAPQVKQANVNKKAADEGSIQERAAKYAAQYSEGTALEDVRLYFADDFRLFDID